MKMDSKYASVDNNSNKRKFEPKKAEKALFFQTKRVKLDKNSNSNTKQKGLPNNNTTTVSLLDHRRSLPVYAVRGRLLEEIKKNDTVIIIGETGSGKTTQIPQLIHEARMEGPGMVGITQPRRVAAITVAMRVAQEMNTTLGEFVGYTVRFEDLTSQRTKVKYMTDGMLLREAMLDPLLMKYSILILDEAHERTVCTDVLFGIIKQAQKERKIKKTNTLKIIVMSATMDVDVFSKYLNGCPVIYLEGRTFPVTIYHTKNQPNDYQQAALCTVFQLHKDSPINEDILVFLTGQEEIETLAYNIRQIAKEIGGGAIRVCPLFASLPQNQQLEVWHPLPPTIRKVILATNIAETSVTIPNIKFVIDTGVVKTRWCIGCAEVLRVEKCSQAACWQRAGRAGRVGPGSCYRLYSAASLKARPAHTSPPILRSPLAPTVLHLLTLGADPLTFDLIDRPPVEAVQEALRLLKQLGAISATENPSLTPVGKKMAAFPIDPRLSKVILSANEFGCLDEVLTIVALLSTDGIFHSSLSKREEALRAKTKFISPHGDHITLLNVYKEFMNSQSQKKWCREHYLKYNNLGYAKNVRQQLVELCQKYKMQMQSCGQAVEKVLKCLISGLFVNTAWVRNGGVSGGGGSGGGRYMTASGSTAAIHPSSVLHGHSPLHQCLLYTELISTQRTYISVISVIQADWLHEIVPDFARKCRITH